MFSVGNGTNILLVKGTVHTGMKERTTLITSASSDIGHLEKIWKKKKQKMMDKSMIPPLSVSKSSSHLVDIVG